LPPDRRPGRAFLVALAIVAMVLSVVVLLVPGLPPQVARPLDLALLVMLVLMIAVAVLRRRGR